MIRGIRKCFLGRELLLNAMATSSRWLWKSDKIKMDDYD
jgi:hypothetical protein